MEELKIINLHSEKQWIEKAAGNDREAQKWIFDKYSPKMLGVCRRYFINQETAEEVMLTGFFKVFQHLNKFENKGYFEAWIRKIMINECISFIRKEKKKHESLDEYEYDAPSEEDTASHLDIESIQNLIDNLPEGYKLVFNLYAIEGYKHNEIATMLNISENTSKSQLHHARKMLQKQIAQIDNYSNEIREY